MRQLQTQNPNGREFLDKSSKKEIDVSLRKKFLENYNACAPQIEQALAAIEKSVREKHPIPKFSFKPEDFIELINNYRLLIQYIPLNDESDTINFKIPCAINILVLVGVFPKNDNFHGVNLTRPCYPLNFSNKVKLAIHNGIKNNEDYYLLRRMHKIHKGDFGDRTFLAVKADGSKLLYLNSSRPASGILASKIARLVSAKHFSSERLLNNGFAGSRELAGFISAVDPTINDERKKYIEVSRRIFPGTGIINEVQNYIGEQDPNMENIGLSSKDFQNNYLVKIDFDLCWLDRNISKETYEKNMLLNRGGIYHALPHVQQDKSYLQEKCYARLKLSLLTTEIVHALAQKVYAGEKIDFEEIGEQYKQRSKICLELFLEDKEQAKEFIRENPEILTQCYAEIAEYIENHFENAKPLIDSLKQQVDNIQAELNTKLVATMVFRAPKFINNPRFNIAQTIDAMSKKALELSSRNFPEASAAAQTLIENLQKTILFYRQGIISLSEFKENSQAHIDIAKLKLEEHRGWKKALSRYSYSTWIAAINSWKEFLFYRFFEKSNSIRKRA